MSPLNPSRLDRSIFLAFPLHRVDPNCGHVASHGPNGRDHLAFVAYYTDDRNDHLHAVVEDVSRISKARSKAIAQEYVSLDDDIAAVLGYLVATFDGVPVYHGRVDESELSHAVVDSGVWVTMLVVSFGDVQSGRYAAATEALVRTSSDRS